MIKTHRYFRPALFIFPAALLCGLLILLCAGKPVRGTDGATQPPNILLITSEDNGPDLGCYGDRNLSTPVLDRLAAKGVKFNQAFVTYSVCSPSRSTIFTGLYPHQNGQIGLATHHFRMYPGITTLPVYLKNAGYRTGCIGKLHVNPESDLPFDFRPPRSSGLQGQNFARKNLDLYSAYADSFFRKSDDPFFLMVNYPDAHTPWKRQVDGMPATPIDSDKIKSPPPFTGVNSARLRGLTADYYNSLERMDEMVGRLLARLKASGKEQNTIIIYLADHGSEFSRGKFSLYEAGLRVPLIIYWPGIPPALKERKELVSSIDLVPTILDAAHVNIPATLPGRSLKPLLTRKEDPDWRHFIFAETNCSFPFDYYPRSSVRDQRFKLIHNLLPERENPAVQYYTHHTITGFEGGSLETEIAAGGKKVREAYKTWQHPPEFELYDLENDPYEFNNLSDNPGYTAVKNKLIQALNNWDKKTCNPFSDKDMLTRFTAEVDSVIKTHPAMDDAKDKTLVWHYTDYFSRYIREHDHTGLLSPAATQAPRPDTLVLFRSGENGYASYRIPAVVTTNHGTLLAFCEGRKKPGDAGDIDLLYKRSTDGGKTWSEQQVIWNDGPNTCGNPCPVVDRRTGVIWLLMTRNNGDDTEREITRKTAQGTRTVWVCSSKDDGRTWSVPADITATTKDPSWGWYATGPGIGIQLQRGPHKGRLVIPCDHSYDDPQGNSGGGPYGAGAHVIYSDDHGKSWRLGGTIRPKVNECQVVELDDGKGTLLMNMRAYFGRHLRSQSRSSDGGTTWTAPEDAAGLPEPVCQASIIRYPGSRRSKDRLLFLNPASKAKRDSMTLKVSYDNGYTWPYARLLYAGPSAYSCMTVLRDGSVGCCYEAGLKNPYEKIIFEKLTPDQLPQD
ncbi:sulfatase-like hydrolase/transferase [Compostibacter hankyongensis]